MSFLMSLIILMVILFGLLLSGVWTGISLGITGVIGFIFFTPFPAGNIISLVAWDCTTALGYVAVPLFILMGELLYESKLSELLFSGLSPWLDNIPGKLLHCNVLACTLFAAVSGSSVATAATIGKFTLPEFKRRNYDPSLSIGSLAGSATIGFLIPPSLIMIVYAIQVNESVGQLFVAGILPGLMMATLFMLYIIIRAKLNPNIAPGVSRHTWKEKLASLRNLIPITFLIIIVLGSIFLGWATPTEAAAVGVLIALGLSLLYKRFSWQMLLSSLKGTLDTTCMVMLIVVGASIFSVTLGYLRVPARFAEAIVAMGLSRYVILMFFGLLYLFLGCFFDGFSMLVMTIPIVFPIVTKLGFNSLWFGIFIVIMIEAAQITPPVGFNLFVIQGITGRSLGFIVKASFPFLLLMVLCIIILTIWPEIALWLPTKMFVQ